MILLNTYTFYANQHLFFTFTKLGLQQFLLHLIVITRETCESPFPVRLLVSRVNKSEICTALRFLADRTNGRSCPSVLYLSLSVCNVPGIYCG